MTVPLAELPGDADVGALRGALAEASTLEVAEELPRLPPDERAVVFRLLPKGRALRVFEALARVRTLGRRAGTVSALPVTDDERRLLGVVELRDLVLAEPDARSSTS